MNAETRLNEILQRISAANEHARQQASGRAGRARLVAVSKTFVAEDVLPVLQAGQREFGENRVQEAQAKWPELKGDFDGVRLHLIGPLQTNKVREAVALFDVIHTLDREKLAAELAREFSRQERRPELLVQVNTGREPQKAGIDPEEAEAFVERCRSVHGLAIRGLMCIPPADEDPRPHFDSLSALAVRFGLPELSMGMSGDFEAAVEAGATLVRVGSAIFGGRPKPIA
ncbi:hypothetical protein SAMN05216548_105159 [Faunimonas pinastri]|uniref:Pyridoxal phosphate homeostasis protein n=1 Tax=Faunimonas pinastri TaxID=1855383 RepID=A0A1H9GV69_9HYPH|nr:YggS family pyridoxal phosphate-dependent enzyme [Faunimonas pinastri]SEQ53964.1 hypothetical protein SAMN05216548_105159 [Faunimonas pinastri]